MFSNLANLFRYRGLIQSLVARELKARYRGSVLGFFWSFINPLLLLLDLLVRLHRRPAETMHRRICEPYALFMFCGILPWTWFSSSLIEAVGLAHLRRQPDQEGAVPGRSPAASSACWRTWCTSSSGCRFWSAFLIYYRHWPDPPDLRLVPGGRARAADLHDRRWR